MTVGMSAATAAAFLSAVFQATGFSYTGVFVQLHVGDPGAAGTANPASNTTRMDASACFGTAPASSDSGTKESIANSVAIGPWTSVPAAETYAFCSLWTAATGGTYIGSGTITAAAVAVGDSFTIPIGDFVAKVPVAA